MAGDINVTVITGRVTRDAELRYTSGGTALCTFSVAVNRRVKKGEQWVDEPNFFDLTLWDKVAENLKQFLNKGAQVAVEGWLKQERWEKDGQHFSKTVISVENVRLMGSAQDGGHERQATKPAPAAADHSQQEFDPSAYEDDIPF